MKVDEFETLIEQAHVPSSEASQQEIPSLLRASGMDPGSFYQEPEMTSRFVDTHHDIFYSNAQLALHSHAFFEILYCRNSCDVEYLIGYDRYRLQKGDVIIVPPGISHRPLFPSDLPEPYKQDVLWISTDFFQLLQPMLPNDLPAMLSDIHMLRTAQTRWEYIGELFRQGVFEADRKRVGWESAVAGNTMQLLTCLYRAILDRTALPLKAEKPELLDLVLAYVESHLAEKITLADVAKHFWVSQSTISQTFRNKMGVSFYRCVTQRRLIAAKSLISDGHTLEDVSRHVGFTDYSSFYRAFKQEYGISPRHYRKLLEMNE